MITIANRTGVAGRLLVAAALASAGAFPAAHADDTHKPADNSAPDLKALAKARVDAAHAAFDEALQAHGQTRRIEATVVSMATAEQVYGWSVRWLDAQRGAGGEKADRVKALEDHVKRMKNLQRHVEQMYKGGLVPRLEVAGAQFYLTEAELWLAQAKAK
jgi:outer membrane protein TolC